MSALVKVKRRSVPCVGRTHISRWTSVHVEPLPLAISPDTSSRWSVSTTSPEKLEMSLGKGPPLDRCCIGSALSTGRRFKREPSRSIVKCDPGADFPWNSEAPSFERGRQPIPQSCPTERQWNNFSLSPASLPESCPTERLWDNLCAAASPVAPAEAGRSHPPQGSYRFRRDARGTMIAPQQIAPRDAHPSIVVPAPKSPSHNPVRTLRYHASHASQGLSARPKTFGHLICGRWLDTQHRRW